MNSVILLRHGKTLCNLKKAYCGALDVPLCEEGIAELYALKENASYPSAKGYTACTSGLRRTNETLRILYGDIPFTEDKAFREMRFGDFEGLTYEALKDRADYQTWITGEVIKNRCPGGESAEEMAARVYARFDELTARDEKRLLLLTHAGPLSWLMLKLFPGEREGWWAWQPAPGHGYMVQLDGTHALSYKELPEEPAACP